MPAAESPSEDAQLVARAAEGDREAFLAIYQRHHAGIFRFARAMTGSTSAAEDVTQEVFLALLRDLGRFDATRGSLTTFLYAVARNTSRYRLRKERRFSGDDPSPDLPSPAGDPSTQLIQAQTTEQVRRMIRALPSRYREVLVLCDLQEFSYAEAAAIVKAPVGTVRSRLHRARQQLAGLLAPADATLLGKGA